MCGPNSGHFLLSICVSFYQHRSVSITVALGYILELVGQVLESLLFFFRVFLAIPVLYFSTQNLESTDQFL